MGGKKKRKTKSERKKEIQKMNIRHFEQKLNEGVLYKIENEIPKYKWVEGFYAVEEGYTTFGVLISQEEVLDYLKDIPGSIYKLYKRQEVKIR